MPAKASEGSARGESADERLKKESVRIQAGRLLGCVKNFEEEIIDDGSRIIDMYCSLD